MDVIERYKEIIASGLYTTVRYRNIRGLVSESDIRFYDPDGNMIAIINPSEECLYGVFNDRFYDTINEAVWELAGNPGEFFD